MAIISLAIHSSTTSTIASARSSSGGTMVWSVTRPTLHSTSHVRAARSSSHRTIATRHSLRPTPRSETSIPTPSTRIRATTSEPLGRLLWWVVCNDEMKFEIKSVRYITSITIYLFYIFSSLCCMLYWLIYFFGLF